MTVEDETLKAVKNVARVLAVFAAGKKYSYVDKIANAPSIDLLVFYLREAIRDFHSMMQKKFEEEEKKIEELIEYAKRVSDRDIEKIYEYCKGDPKKLREICSLIGATALAISARYIEEEG